MRLVLISSARDHGPYHRRMTGSDPDLGRSRLAAAVGSTAFFFAAPCVMGGLIPWLLTGWEVHAWWLPLRILGAALTVAGAAVVIAAFVRFVVEGVGTPAPVAPTRHLVVGGMYRYVRNPMYVAVTATVVGQGLFLGQPVLFAAAAVFAAAVAAFVYGYEEPTLQRQFGASYDAYRRAVPAWRPRLRPWSGP
jgi:protein-S-isoprenylcysteine O-methyltransferase Ste14